MEAHVRGSIFFGSLLVAPILYAVGDRLGGTVIAVSVATAAVAGAMVLMALGGSPRPPAGSEPS